MSTFFTFFFIYLVVWWTVLFAILPLGTQTRAEAGLPNDGSDPGAPVDPKLKKKFITTTWVSALLFAPFWIAVHFHWLSLGMFRNFG